jgi:hypothetical protein
MTMFGYLAVPVVVVAILTCLLLPLAGEENRSICAGIVDEAPFGFVGTRVASARA